MDGNRGGTHPVALQCWKWVPAPLRPLQPGGDTTASGLSVTCDDETLALRTVEAKDTVA